MPQTYAADFHIHSTYSGGTSDKMLFSKIAEQAELKGLDFVGTGDILNPNWRELFHKSLVKMDEGTYKHPSYDTNFILTVEVEDRDRVHHLIVFPSLSKVDDMKERLQSYSSDINIEGRPTVNMDGAGIAEIAFDLDCLIGPCHAFTPWTSVYKEFDSLNECYEDQIKKVNFLELGLSADTGMADRIEELEKLTFLSNSDAHSPWPNKLGREFNRFELSEPISSEIIDSIKKRKNITLNVGLDPELGKYHLTACSRCHRRYSIDEANSLSWKCNECGGSIKKGVSDRVDELADFESPRYPDFRPDYLRIAPLSEIIALSLHNVSPRTRKVQRFWRKLIDRLGDEISVLIDADPSEIKKVTNEKISGTVEAFRGGNLKVRPGGGGEYGNLEISSEFTNSGKDNTQWTLSEFGV